MESRSSNIYDELDDPYLTNNPAVTGLNNTNGAAYDKLDKNAIGKNVTAYDKLDKKGWVQNVAAYDKLDNKRGKGRVQNVAVYDKLDKNGRLKNVSAYDKLDKRVIEQKDVIVRRTELQPHPAARKRNKRWIIITLVSIVLVGNLATIVYLFTKSSKNGTDNEGPNDVYTTEDSVKTTSIASTTIRTTPISTTQRARSISILGGCDIPPTAGYGFDRTMVYGDGRARVLFTAKQRHHVDTFDHCPVSYCTERNQWSSFNISVSASECYNVVDSGAIYSGKNTCTLTGRTCQRWDVDYPHRRGEGNIPKNQRDLLSNYCLDTGPPYGGRPWCYTTDPAKRWEFCHVPYC